MERSLTLQKQLRRYAHVSLNAEVVIFLVFLAFFGALFVMISV